MRNVLVIRNMCDNRLYFVYSYANAIRSWVCIAIEPRFLQGHRQLTRVESVHLVTWLVQPLTVEFESSPGKLVVQGEYRTLWSRIAFTRVWLGNVIKILHLYFRDDRNIDASCAGTIIYYQLFACVSYGWWIFNCSNTLRTWQNCRHFADDI